MNARQNRYAMLVCSLPALPSRLFTEHRTPISRLQLDRRLVLLTAEDAELLSSVEAVLHWDRLPLDMSEHQAVADFRATLAALPAGMVREVVRWRLEDRTLMAALRRRQRGRPAPEKNEDWGCGRWVGRIRQAWREPTFGLAHRFPWAAEAARRLAAGDSTGLERLLLGHTWDGLGRLGEPHHFDFEAVLVYVLKWDIIRRWSSYNGEAARRRFMDLSDAGMGSQPVLFAR